MRNWSEQEFRVMYGSGIIGSDCWDHENKIPVFTPAPPSDHDFVSRLLEIAPHLAEQIRSTKPAQKISYETAMLSAQDLAAEQEKRRLEQQFQEQRKSKAELEHFKISMQNNPTKLLTSQGKIVSIIQGWCAFIDGGQWFPRGDKYTNIPVKMIDDVYGYFMGKARLMTECKIWYNRDSRYQQGKNLIFHWQAPKKIKRQGNLETWYSGKVVCDRLQEIKLLLQ